MCAGCWVEMPPTCKRKKTMETWRHFRGKMFCGYCGNAAVADGSQLHRKSASQSVRRRAVEELNLVLTSFKGGVRQTKIAALRKAIKNLPIADDDGPVMRCGKKRSNEAAEMDNMIAQLHRSRERFASDPSLTCYRNAYKLALVALGDV